MTQREHLHLLIDDLPETELPPAVRFLEFLRSQKDDPFPELHRQALADDESVTDEDLAAIQEGLEDLRAGRTLSHDELRAELAKDPRS